MRAVVAFLYLALAVGSAPRVAAQSIRGELVDETSGEPIAAAFVALLRNTGEVGRTLTDHRGRFTFDRLAPGSYQLKSQIIGVKSVTTPAFQLASGKPLEYRLAIPAVLIVLPALVVVEERMCRVRANADPTAALLWEEAQKALNAIIWTEERQLLRHRMVRYERQLDPVTREITEQRSWTQTGLYRGSPFGSPPAAELAESGYIQTAGDQWIYYGPDAKALLSESFAGEHCFVARESDIENPGLVGLAFEPTQQRGAADVEGVLWVDRQTAELRYLDFKYTDPPWDIEFTEAGGRIEFERLATGPWIVRRWWLRMPMIGIKPTAVNRFGAPRGDERIISAVQETGGWVSNVYTHDGRPVGRAGGSSIVGSLLDGASGKPLPNAQISLIGTIYEQRTDDSGRFRFDDLPEGTYAVTYVHEILDGMGFVPPPGEITLDRDQVITVELSVPTLEVLWPNLCPNSDPATGIGIVSGFVREARNDQPVANARVELSVARYNPSTTGVDTLRFQGVTDWAGYYLICDIPSDVPAHASVNREGWAGDNETVLLASGEIARQDFELREVEVVRARKRYTRGVGIGGTVGFFAVDDRSNIFGSAPGFEGHLRVNALQALQIKSGVHFSQHSIGAVEQRYNLFQLFLEPRYVIRNFSHSVAPFVGGRVSRAWERVNESGVDMRGSGYGFGGSLGVLINVNDRVSFEGGTSLGTLSFGDFDFAGEQLWDTCLQDHRSAGTQLPAAVVACAPPPNRSDFPQLIPGEGVRGVGSQVRQLHPDSGRRDSWLEFWFGISFRTGRSGDATDTGNGG